MLVKCLIKPCAFCGFIGICLAISSRSASSLSCSSWCSCFINYGTSVQFDVGGGFSHLQSLAQMWMPWTNCPPSFFHSAELTHARKPIMIWSLLAVVLDKADLSLALDDLALPIFGVLLQTSSTRGVLSLLSSTLLFYSISWILVERPLNVRCFCKCLSLTCLR